MLNRRSAHRPTINDEYEIISRVGCGGYSNVFKAKERSSGKIVALKKVNKFSSHTGLPISFFRETKCLKEMKGNEYIINFRKIIQSKKEKSLYLVLDYCEFDLAALISNYGLSEFQIKSYMKQILLGMLAVHDHGYIHRDLKPSNVFVTQDGRIKLGDFGLTRKVLDFNSEGKYEYPQNSREKTMTTKIMTQSYRPLEVLLGDTNYDQSVDIWSLACIFYEMLTGKVLFCPSSSTDIAQIVSILRICGSPNHESWPGFDELPNSDYFKMTQTFVPVLRELLEQTINPQFHCLIDLLESMLELDPKKRITVQQALEHPFFNDQSPFIPKLSNDNSIIAASSSESPPPSPIQNSENMEISILQNTSIEDDLEMNYCSLPYPEIHIMELVMLNNKSNDTNSIKKRKEINSRNLSKFRDEFRPNLILPPPILC